MDGYRRYLSKRLAGWLGRPSKGPFASFWNGFRDDEPAKATHPVFDSAKVSTRASRSSRGVKVESDDGVMHLRVDMDVQTANRRGAAPTSRNRGCHDRMIFDHGSRYLRLRLFVVSVGATLPCLTRDLSVRRAVSTDTPVCSASSRALQAP